ncbi:MAG: hypothetical protein JJ956_10675 [Pseudomonadales bacterium]|nr:hypothetical protein [Pseudomonadales bacterium]
MTQHLEKQINDLRAELVATKVRLNQMESAFRRNRAFLNVAGLGVVMTFLLFGGGVVIAQGGMDALFIDPDGNVGIGTSTPLKALDVHGGAIISESVAMATSSGSVGVGTTEPNYKLDVKEGFFHTTHNVQTYPPLDSEGGLVVASNRSGHGEVNLYNVSESASLSYVLSQSMAGGSAKDLITVHSTGDLDVVGALRASALSTAGTLAVSGAASVGSLAASAISSQSLAAVAISSESIVVTGEKTTYSDWWNPGYWEAWGGDGGAAPPPYVNVGINSCPNNGVVVGAGFEQSGNRLVIGLECSSP